MTKGNIIDAIVENLNIIPPGSAVNLLSFVSPVF